MGRVDEEVEAEGGSKKGDNERRGWRKRADDVEG